MTEAQITKMMETLKISREEAIEVIKDDEAIDKGEKLFELTSEQKKNAKTATITTGDKRKRTAKTASPKERKPDDVKREIISTIAQNLDRCCFGEECSTVADVIILKPEKEITFKVNGEEYSITLTKHRKVKGQGN